jgi:hypothetical protein
MPLEDPVRASFELKIPVQAGTKRGGAAPALKKEVFNFKYLRPNRTFLRRGC